MELAGKVAVITGAAGGIGAALARRFAAEGAAGLVLADLGVDSVDALAASLATDTLAVGADVTREADVRRLAQPAGRRLGRGRRLRGSAAVTAGAGRRAP